MQLRERLALLRSQQRQEEEDRRTSIVEEKKVLSFYLFCKKSKLLVHLNLTDTILLYCTTIHAPYVFLGEEPAVNGSLGDSCASSRSADSGCGEEVPANGPVTLLQSTITIT